MHSCNAVLRSDVGDLPEEERINSAHLFSFYQCITSTFQFPIFSASLPIAFLIVAIL